MKHKVSELTGALLDAAVAKADGVEVRVQFVPKRDPDPVRHMSCWRWVDGRPDFKAGPFCPSQDWALGGPIIEREGISIERNIDHAGWDSFFPGLMEFGPTPLIAAMRLYVTAKFGWEVELPDQTG